jgi:hypothetical protein
MKISTLILLGSLAVGGSALAQGSATARGSASADSSASVSAGREGASASQSGRTSGSAATEHAAASFAEGTEMQAELTRPVSARKAEPGDEVTARLSENMQASSGMTLSRGTMLMGRVTEARPRDRRRDDGRGDSRLGVVFDRAVLKDGTEIPVAATIQAVAAAEASAFDSTRGLGAASGAGRAASAGRAGGGLVGSGVTGVAGGAIDIAGSVTRSPGGAAGASTRVLGSSAGAIGGLDAAGRLSSGSRGVFNLRGMTIEPMTAGAAGSVLTSSSSNVQLERGTRMLLVTGSRAAASGTASTAAR